MKIKIIAFIIVQLFLSKLLIAQNLFLLTEDIYSIVDIKNNEYVTVHGESANRSIKEKFYTQNDSIYILKVKGLRHFPYYISVKNNQFKVSFHANDSLVHDNLGRVTAVYNVHDKIVQKNKYINDTTILGLAYYSTNHKIYSYLYELDKYYNLKTWYRKVIPDEIRPNEDSLLDINKVDFKRVTYFNYDTSRKQIDSIKTYYIGKDFVQLFRRQVFIYKNGRPDNSSVNDEPQQSPFYTQCYHYKHKK